VIFKLGLGRRGQKKGGVGRGRKGTGDDEGKEPRHGPRYAFLSERHAFPEFVGGYFSHLARWFVVVVHLLLLPLLVARIILPIPATNSQSPRPLPLQALQVPVRRICDLIQKTLI